MQLLLHSTFLSNKHSLFILLFKIIWSRTLEAEWFWSAHKSHHKLDWNYFFLKKLLFLICFTAFYCKQLILPRIKSRWINRQRKNLKSQEENNRRFRYYLELLLLEVRAEEVARRQLLLSFLYFHLHWSIFGFVLAKEIGIIFSHSISPTKVCRFA